MEYVLNKQNLPDEPGTSSPRKKCHDALQQQLKKEVTFHTCRGQAVLLSEWWNRFQELCNESIPFYYKSRRAFFKYTITKIIPNITIIPWQGTDLEDDLLISSSLSLAKICRPVNGNSDIAE